MIQYMIHKDFTASLQKMSQQGGESKRIADKIWGIWGKAQSNEVDPFYGLPLTKNGESRIKHARKYDISNGYRLITIHDQKVCMFCFSGNHANCDLWLNRNTGLTIVRNKDNEYDAVIKSVNIHVPDLRATADSDFVSLELYKRLDKNDLNRFVALLPPSLVADMLSITAMTTDDQIYQFVSQIQNSDLSCLAYDVLIALRAGDRNRALARIDLHLGQSQQIDDLNDDEILEINDGMSIKKLKINSDEYREWFRQFINSSGYQDWMLFMHPAQQRIVDQQYEGSAKLSGVSGSGKTCIVVNRAIRLAKNVIDKPILILTLNKSLAGLIQELVYYACPDEIIRNKIICKSFFELCQDYLYKFEPGNIKLYDDITWKHEEHIDEIWREFYRCELNNFDASVMLPIHKSLNGQGINPEEYLRQEIDWLRSAYRYEDRYQYLDAERKGRAIPLQRHQRELVLKGLDGWNKKMSDIGVIDYLGLASKLCNHIDALTPDYAAILVDEVQDFGTIELNIVRKIVSEGANDIFLCGDLAQSVLPKHQSFKDAGIEIPGARSLKIIRNYRNSREILRAAYELFVTTMQEASMDGDMLLLDPEFANFSTPKPLVLSADSLEIEISYALSYINDLSYNDQNHKGCIAIAGFSLLEIKRFADKYGIQVLDGSKGLLSGKLFMSDLEQTKGYEFDTMCVLNCRQDILPPVDMPVEEQFRDACRFYVAMTRAKKQLIISYSGAMSKWLGSINCKPYFDFDSWVDVHFGDTAYLGVPEKIPQLISDPEICPSELPGRRFIYTKHAIGLSVELQDKIDQLVDGLGRSRDGKRVNWPKMKDALEDVRRHPYAKQLFGGQKTWKDFVSVLESIIA